MSRVRNVNAKRFARSVYLTKGSEKIARAESICREVGEPIKDFKASRANEVV